MAKTWVAGEKVNAADLNLMVVPCGAILPFAAVAAPTGWLLCDGSSLLRASYPDLFAVIGTTYGAADGTHFTLPSMKGKIPVGYNASETEFDAMGETGGEKTHTLSESEIPAHDHDGTMGQGFAAGSGPYVQYGTTNSPTSGAVPSAGGGGAHNNLQPYITLQYIIRY